MSEFEDAFDRVKGYVGDFGDIGPDYLIDCGCSDGVHLWFCDLKVVIDRLEKMIKEQREEALSEMAKHDAELILKGY